jgi:drug/metabolite transporter (DMT)-like permease
VKHRKLIAIAMLIIAGNVLLTWFIVGNQQIGPNLRFLPDSPGLIEELITRDHSYLWALLIGINLCIAAAVVWNWGELER